MHPIEMKCHQTTTVKDTKTRVANAAEYCLVQGVAQPHPNIHLVSPAHPGNNNSC